MKCRSRCLVLLPLVAALAACASTQQRPAAKSGKVDEGVVGALYARLDADVKRYEAGQALLDTGEDDRGRHEVGAALDDLRSAALQCHSVAGCEEDRFLSAFDGLLRRRGDTAVAEGAKDAAGAGPENAADTTPGESSPVVANLPEAARSVTLLKGKELSDILTLNGPVKAALEEWLTQYRPFLMQTYVNYQFLRYRMWPEYQKAGLPEALLFGVLAKESGARVHSVSRSGASGPLQFMYTTGLRFGLTTVNGFDQRFDPGLSARANAAYFNEQLRIFNNNVELVLGAYNGGEGRMQRLAGATGSFWDARVYAALAPETREYVPMVLAAAWLYLHPEKYNLTFPKVDGKPGSVTLTAPASLTELAVCFGQEGGMTDGWFRTLRNLNPALEPAEKLAVGTKLEVPSLLETAYPKVCGSGNWQALAQDLHSAVVPVVPARVAQAARATAGRSYTVRNGDTLGAIARKLGCADVKGIAGLNGLRAPGYAIRAGQVLKVPGC